MARKLFKSGAIPAIQKPQMKQDQMSFKRPKGQERKRVIPESNVASYQPFSATQPDGFQGATSSLDRDTNRVHNCKSKRNSNFIHSRYKSDHFISISVYQQIATERDREERGLTEKKPTEALPTLATHRTEKQRTGNTICVSGNNVTEEFLRTQFTIFGKIVSVSMEIEKGRGFITFIKTESADRAINDMHSKTVSGISLQVQLARRQPQIEPINHASSSVVWSTLGKHRSTSFELTGNQVNFIHQYFQPRATHRKEAVQKISEKWSNTKTIYFNTKSPDNFFYSRFKFH